VHHRKREDAKRRIETATAAELITCLQSSVKVSNTVAGLG